MSLVKEAFQAMAAHPLQSRISGADALSRGGGLKALHSVKATPIQELSLPRPSKPAVIKAVKARVPTVSGLKKSSSLVKQANQLLGYGGGGAKPLTMPKTPMINRLSGAGGGAKPAAAAPKSQPGFFKSISSFFGGNKGGVGGLMSGAVKGLGAGASRASAIRR